MYLFIKNVLVIEDLEDAGNLWQQKVPFHLDQLFDATQEILLSLREKDQN